MDPIRAGRMNVFCLEADVRGDPRFDLSRRSSRLAIASCEGWFAKAEALAEKIVPAAEFKGPTASK